MKPKIDDIHLAFQKLIEHSSWGITLLDAQFKVIYRSPSAERINGWENFERSPETREIAIHPDDELSLNALMQRVSQIAGATETCTFRSKNYSGDYIWLQCSFTNMLQEANINALVCNFIDVSKQKLSELELTKQTEQTIELLETMTDGFISLDENLCYTYVNGQTLKMVKKTREELIGYYIWDIFPNAVGSATYDAVQTAFTEKKYVCNEDFYAPFQLWQENRVYPSAGGISLFIRDITKQKKEEHRFKLLESVITNTTDAVVITEAEPFDLPSPRILYVNEAFTRMTGYTAEEVIGRTPRILQGPKTDKAETQRLGECMRRWELCETTLINYKKNGEEFWINFSLSPVADQNGWFTHWISIERDVTQRKNEELQKALLAEISQLFNERMNLNSLLQEILEKVVSFDHFVIGEIWLIGADKNKMTMVAKTSQSEEGAVFYKETINYTSFAKGESMPGAVWESGKILEWNHLGNRPNFHRNLAARKAGVKMAYGIPIISEKVTIGVLVVGSREERPPASQSLIPLFETLSTQFGKEIRRKQLEEELRQIFTLAPDIICTLGTDDRYFKKVNPAMSHLLGYTEAELLKHPLDFFVHPEDLPSSKLRIQKFAAGEKAMSFEARFITKAGKTLWISWTVNLNEREGLLFCVAKDITDKKRVEERLVASETNLNAIIENTDAMIYSLDAEFRYVTYNDKLSRMMQEFFGVSIFPGYSVFDFISAQYPNDVKEWKNIYNKGFAGESVQFEKEYTVGSRHVYNSFSFQPIWHNENVTGLSCFVVDITDRKLADLRLQESEKRYSELFQSSPLPKLVLDIETLKFLDVNKAAINQYGYTKEEFLKMSIYDLRPSEEPPVTDEMIAQIKQTTGITEHYAITHQKKNGQKISVDIQSNPVSYGGKSARSVVSKDITENLNYVRAIEAQNKKLKEISWMQSHVVRAPLSRIMGLISLMEVSDDLPEETKKVMEYLSQSASELDEVIRDINLKTTVIDPDKI